MVAVAEQLPLPLTLHPEWTFESFQEGPNSEAIAHLKAAARGTFPDPFIVLVGLKGHGKSHLLNAVSEDAHRHHQGSLVLPLKDLTHNGPQLLEDLDHLDCLCLDDVDDVLGHPAWDLALMMMYQQRMNLGKPLLISLSCPVGDIKACLPDLSSRIAGGLILNLKPLSDEDLLSVLIHRSQSLGMELTPSVGRYLMTHTPRSLSSLMPLLERLDQASLAAQRRLTIPFIKTQLSGLHS